MIDAGSALRSAYATLLASLTYEGKPVKVRAMMAQPGDQAPYVIVGPWQGQKDNTKSSFGQKGEINLDIVTRLPTGFSSTKAAGAIADLITNILKPTPTAEVLVVEGFRVWNTQVVSTTDLIQPGSTDVTIRKVITIEHNLTQV